MGHSVSYFLLEKYAAYNPELKETLGRTIFL